MPQSAIEAGCVDHVLSCEEIARALAQVGRHSPLPQVQPPAAALEEPASEPGFTSILHLLSKQSGVDVLSDMPAILQRRIESRMALVHLAHQSAYTAYLREHPDEVEALAQSLLIAVTDFFRDPAVFEALTRLVWPTLLERLERQEPLRIWVPGCATGEEAYSLAISLLEFLQAHEPSQPFQIFASDVNPKVLAQARSGIYAASALSPEKAERLQRDFTSVDQQGSRYRIDARVRRALGLRPAQSAAGSAFHSPGPDQLPQCAHGRAGVIPAADRADLALCARARRLPPAGNRGKQRAPRATVSPGRAWSAPVSQASRWG